MTTIDDLFILHTAKSSGFSSYQSGKTAFVTNGFRNNGVLGFVTPKAKDKVFSFVGIALSAFLEATVQVPPFIARGNGGSGLIVLEPKQAIPVSRLLHIAAYINRALSWRFSWYRQATSDRIRHLPVPFPESLPAPTFRVISFLPTDAPTTKTRSPLIYAPFRIGSLYNLHPGEYHSILDLNQGDTPIVACGGSNNGIAGYVQVPSEHIHANRLTIAFNGATLTAKYHPYSFAAKDDVAVCVPKLPLRLTTELFMQAMIGREQWRFSYYRKCFRQKLENTEVLMPVKQGSLDEDLMEEMIQATSYWEFLKKHLVREEESEPNGAGR